MFDKILALCEEKKISLADLERLANLKPRTIYKWKTVVPSAKKVFAVATALGVTVEALMTKEAKIEN